MSGLEKNPSALDYGAHLHELALGSWTRAMLADAPLRATDHARRLAESPEKLWRFIGLHHVGLGYAGAGQVSAALDALAGALRSYPGSSPVVTAARRTTAQLHLETRSPQSALTVLGAQPLGREDAASRYFRALALARLDRHAPAMEHTVDLSPAAACHVRAELTGELDELSRHTVDPSPLPWTEDVPLRAAVAESYIERGDPERAAAVLETVVETREAILHWPVAYARGLYRLAVIDSGAGRTGRAAQGFRRFLALWHDAEIDRSQVEKASQLSSA